MPDRRKTAKHSRDPLPLGTVSIRKRRAGPNGRRTLKVPMIKVARNAQGFRWMAYARHWWEQNRGPVPDGMCVAHKDGNPLNTDPENFILCTPGDVVYLAHERDPEMSKRNFAKLKTATADCNRERGQVNRALNYLRTWWYPVDLRRGLVINEPARKRWMTIRNLGIAVPKGNDDAAIAAGLGWSGQTVSGACVLAALAEAAPLGLDNLTKAANRFRELIGRRKPLFQQSLYQFIKPLVTAGLVTTRRTRQGRLYELAESTKPRAERVAIVISVRGADLRKPQWEGLEKVEPEPRCRICGCTQYSACEHEELGACWWVPNQGNLCSHCAFLEGIQLPEFSEGATLAQ